MSPPYNLEYDGGLAICYIRQNQNLTMTFKIKLRSPNLSQPLIKVLCYIVEILPTVHEIP